MKSFGIDVSKWQGNFNFSQAKKEGVTFAILKAGGSDSGRYKDKKFEQFYVNCKSLNIPVGAYYFGNDKTVANAIKSAEHFVSLLTGKTFELPVYYDVEGVMLRLGKKPLTDIIKAFCDTVKKYGYKVGVYSSASPFNSSFNDKELKEYSHWVARYSKTKPTLASGNNIDIWQFGGTPNFIRTNKIAGVVCDQNYCYVDFGQNVGKPLDKPITTLAPKPFNVITSLTGIGKVKCPEPISGSIDFDLLDWSIVFDWEFYKNKYSDLTKNGLKTREQFTRHFLTRGMSREFRQGNSLFNPMAYRQNNPDLVDIFGNDWKWYYAHYICCGMREGRTCR